MSEQVPSKELAAVEQKLRGMIADLYRDEPDIQRLAKLLVRVSECMMGNEHAVTILRQKDCLTLSAYISKLNGAAHEPPAEQLPSAWIKGHTLHTDAGIEYDEEVVPGSDRPKGDGWHPLYSRPSQPPRVGINGAGEILGCTCQMCEFHRSAEAIERHRRATSTKEV